MANKITSEQDSILSLPTGKGLLKLAIPIVSGKILRNVFNLIDVAFIGRLGATAVAGVTTSGVIMMPIFALVIGITTATRAMVSRYFSSDRDEEFKSAISSALFYGVVLSILFLAVSQSIDPQFFVTIMGVESKTSVKIYEYMRIITLGGFTRVFFFIIATIFQAVGDAKTPLKILSLTLGINVILDPLVIFGLGPFPKLGVEGAALATVFAWGIGTIICFILLMKKSSAVEFRIHQFSWDTDILTRMLKVGSPAMLRIGLGHVGSIILMRIVAAYGTVVLAALGICMRIRLLTFLPAIAVGNAAGILVGQNLGVQRPKEADKVGYTANRYYQYIAIPLSIILIVFGSKIMRIFTIDPEVIAAGANYLAYYGFALPAFILAIVFSKAMEGAGDTLPPFIITLSSIFGIQIAGAYILPSWLGIGVRGVWLAVMLAMIARGAIITYWFKRGKWKEKKL